MRVVVCEELAHFAQERSFQKACTTAQEALQQHKDALLYVHVRACDQDGKHLMNKYIFVAGE